MTRRLRNSSSRGLPSRFASFAGVVTLASAGLFVSAPALADVAPETDAVLVGQCEEAGFSVALNGTITLDAGETVTSYLRVAGDAATDVTKLTGADDGSAIDVSIETTLIEGDETYFVEWVVDKASVVQGEFSRAAGCDVTTPSPTPAPTDSPTPTLTPTESPTPTPTPTASPEPTPTPTPTPTASPEPSASPTPVPTKAPVPSEEPVPSQEPKPVPSTTPPPAAPVTVPLAMSLSSTSVPAAGTVTVNASGFAPGEQLELWLHSDPWRLTTATADANGELSLSVGIAGGTDIGEHQIEVRGATSGSVFADVLVTDDLAITGIDSAFASGVATTGLVLVLGGVTVVLLARRARIQAET